MPIAESELVAGYMTEYSGLRFLLFFIAEFASAGAFAALAATMFLGGWYLPGLDASRQLHERASDRSSCSRRSCSSAG